MKNMEIQPRIIIVLLLLTRSENRDTCNNSLGFQNGLIKDVQFTAVTAYDNNMALYGPQRARLHTMSWPQGYRGNVNSKGNSWLSVTLDKRMVITGVATQGYGEKGTSEWITQFLLLYSDKDDDTDYSNYFSPAKSTSVIFQGNKDSKTVHRQDIRLPAIASKVKMFPIGWNGNVGIRMELYGCTPGYHVNAWLMFVQRPFTLEFRNEHGEENKRLAYETVEQIKKNLQEVHGYLGVSFREFSPQKSSSGFTFLTAEVEIPCLEQSIDRVVKKIMSFVMSPGSVFDNNFLELQFSRTGKCDAPLVIISPPTENESKSRAILRNSFPVFHAEVRANCNFPHKLLFNWDIAKVDTKSGQMSPFVQAGEPNQRRFRLNPRRYPSIETLYVRCVASMQGRSQETFAFDYIYVQLIDAELIAKIKGPLLAIKGVRNVSLDGSQSYFTIDPKWSRSVNVRYNWYCNTTTSVTQRLSKEPFCSEHRKIISRSKLLQLDGNVLEEEKEYTFELTLNADGITASVFHKVTVESYTTLAIRCLSNCARKINPLHQQVLQVKCTGTACKKVSRYVWSISFFENGSKIWKNVQSTSSSTSQTMSGMRLTIKHLTHVIKSKEGGDEVYTIKVTARFDEYLGIQSEADFILNSVPNNAASNASGCMLSPREGFAMKTYFMLSCERWEDEDTPLSYKFQYMSEFGLNILQSGFSLNVSAQLLPGQKELDYMFDMETVIIDSLGAKQTLKLPVKVRPPSTSEANLMLQNIGNELEMLIASGDPDKAADMSLFALSMMKIVQSPPEAEVKTKDNILRHMGDVKVDSLPQVTKFAAVASRATLQPVRISQKSQKKAVTLIETTSNTMKSLVTNGSDDVDLSLLRDIATNFINAVSNILNSSITDVSGEDSNINLRKNEGKEVSKRCANVTHNVASMITFLKKIGEGPTTVTSGKVTIQVERDITSSFDNKQVEEGQSRVILPHSDELFPNTCTAPSYMDVQVIKFTTNPFFWDKSASAVKSEVLDINIFTKSKGKLNISGLALPVSLFLPNMNKEDSTMFQADYFQTPMYFVKPTLNASSTRNMQFHNVLMASSYVTLTITVIPEQGKQLDIFVRSKVRPTAERYDYKTKVPDLSSCGIDKYSKGKHKAKCSKDLYTFEINSKITGATGLHFIGIRFVSAHDRHDKNYTIPLNPDAFVFDDETAKVEKIKGKNTFSIQKPRNINSLKANNIKSTVETLSSEINPCHSRNGRQKRSCVGVKDPAPTLPPPMIQLTPEYDEGTDVNYTLSVSQSACLYWLEENEQWTNHGCKLGPNSNATHVHCLCNHLSAFGGDFFVAPNPIDFDKVLLEFSRLEKTGNFVVLATVCFIWATYLLGLVIAGKADKHDSRKILSGSLSMSGSHLEHKYTISIQTGVWRGSGTTANVGLIIYGDDSHSLPLYLKNNDAERTFFARGSLNTFIVGLPLRLGHLFKVKLWHDNSGKNPAWFVEDITIAGEEPGEKWYFLVNRWIAVNKDDGRIEIDAPESEDKEVLTFKNLFYSRVSKQFSDSHLWLSLFARSAQSPFTRCQRLSCCLLIMFSTMITNAMFYQFGEKKNDYIQIGQLKANLNGIKIGLQSAVLVLPITLLAVIIFKNIKREQLIPNDNDFENMEKKVNGCLPNGFVLVAWFSCLIVAGVSSVFTIFYSIMWGEATSNQWLFSTMVSFTEDVFLIQPMKIIILASILALLVTKQCNIHEGVDLSNLQVLDPKQVVKVPSPAELTKSRDLKVKKAWLTSTMIEISLFLFYLLLVFTVCYVNRDHTRFIMNKSLKDLFPDFEQINDTPSFWSWTRRTLIPGLYNITWYNGQKFDYNEGFISNRKMFMVGMPRIRQLRVIPDVHCLKKRNPAVTRIFYRCLPEYGVFTQETSPYNLPGWESVQNVSKYKTTFELENLCPTPWRYQSARLLQTLVYIASGISYRGGGFVANLGYNMNTTSSVIDDLEGNNWIDDKTVAVFVELTVFNPTSSLFSSLKYLYERFPSGGSNKITMVNTIIMYSPTDKVLYVFLQVCQLLLGIILLVFIALELFKMYKQGCKYVRSIWNWVEWIQMASVVSSITMFVMKEKYTSEFVRSVQENPFKTSSTDYVVLWFDLEIVLLSFVVFIMTIKLLRLIRFNAQVCQMTATFKRSAKYIAVFCVFFLVIMIACSTMASLAFGKGSVTFSSFPRSLANCIILIVGGKFYSQNLEAIDSELAPLFLVIYTLCTYMFLINFLMSILNDCFTEAKDELDPGDIVEAEYAYYMMEQINTKLRFKLTKFIGIIQRLFSSKKMENGKANGKALVTKSKTLKEPSNHYKISSPKETNTLQNSCEFQYELENDFLENMTMASPTSPDQIICCCDLEEISLQEVKGSLAEINDILKIYISDESTTPDQSDDVFSRREVR